MKSKLIQELAQQLDTLNADEQRQLKGGYGRILGQLVSSRTNRWDDIPFRRTRPRSGAERAQPQTGDQGFGKGFFKQDFLLP